MENESNHRHSISFWLTLLVVIFLVLFVWSFPVHESAHYATCALSDLQPSMVDYRTGNCAGLDTSPSWTFFMVKSAPYLLDVVAGLFLWFLIRRIDVVGLLARKRGIAQGKRRPARDGSSIGNTPLTKGIVLFAALNSWAVAVLFDVASNYAGSLMGFTDFLSMIAYDPRLFLPAVAVSFLGMLFACLFLREEWMGIRVRLRGRKRLKRDGWRLR